MPKLSYTPRLCWKLPVRFNSVVFAFYVGDYGFSYVSGDHCRQHRVQRRLSGARTQSL